MHTMWYNSNLKMRSIMEDITGKSDSSSSFSGTYYENNDSVPFMVCLYFMLLLFYFYIF